MTNEEKATKISEKYENWWAMEAPDVSGASFESAMTMAEWKDKQYAKAFAPILIELDELKHQIKSLLP